jgi:hypothetical protein
MDSEQVDKCEIIWGYLNKRDSGMPDSFVKSPCNPVEMDLSNRVTLTVVFNSNEQWEISEVNNYRVGN